MHARRPLLAALAFALAACDRVPSDAVTRCEASRVVPSSVKTDILFVVDDSQSMAANQQNLHDNLSAFIQVLASAPIANDFQIGVTNTSVEGYPGAAKVYAAGTPSAGTPYPAGALIAVARDATSGSPIAGQFVYDASAKKFGGSRILAAGSPTLVQDFQANVLVGTDGSLKEQPLRAARLALSDRIADGTNAGFLRPGARLAVVFLSDEDDCSDSDCSVAGAPCAASDTECHSMTWKVPGGGLDAVADYVAFLRGPIAGETRDVVAATIVGVDPVSLVPSCGNTTLCTDNTCRTAFDKADRFVELDQQLGTVRTRAASICDPSFRTALEEIAGLLVSQSMPLDGTPADWRMLAVGVERGTATIPCTVALEGTTEATTADAVYTAPQKGQPASLTFQNDCRLQQGDRAQVDIICAG
jgi:hypothetical protein